METFLYVQKNVLEHLPYIENCEIFWVGRAKFRDCPVKGTCYKVDFNCRRTVDGGLLLIMTLLSNETIATNCIKLDKPDVCGNWHIIEPKTGRDFCVYIRKSRCNFVRGVINENVFAMKPLSFAVSKSTHKFDEAVKQFLQYVEEKWKPEYYATESDKVWVYENGFVRYSKVLLNTGNYAWQYEDADGSKNTDVPVWLFTPIKYGRKTKNQTIYKTAEELCEEGK